MAENRYDQQENLGSQQNQGAQNRKGTTSGTQMNREVYEEDDPNNLGDQEHNQDSQSYQERTSSGSPLNRERFEEDDSNSSSFQGSQRRDEYSSPDNFEELEEDELEDDEMISRVDVEKDMDILDDDENPQMNRQGF